MTNATFATRKEANEIIDGLDSCVYHLAHGEYARPEYRARKVRGEEKFYIHARRHYFFGTFHAQPSGALKWDDNELFSRY